MNLMKFVMQARDFNQYTFSYLHYTVKDMDPSVNSLHNQDSS